MRYLFFIMSVLIISNSMNGQISVNVNIESQPIWGPVGYEEVQYYYMPEIEAYYYVPQHQFIYMENGKWKKSLNLPNRYANYNLFNGYKVVINEDRPYNRNKDYRAKYIAYKDKHDQNSIRDSRDSKYFVNKNHPQHNNWMKKQNNGNNKGNNHENKESKSRKK